MVNFKGKPFYLNDEDIEWINKTYESMSLEERIGQLFFPIILSTNDQYLQFAIMNKHPGGVFYRSGPKEELTPLFNKLQSMAKVPLLNAANLEAGGDGAIVGGTSYGKQMQIGATRNKQYAYELGKIGAKEGRVVGINYAFAPVCDIDMNYHNPIVNVRSYGDDKNRVLEFASEFIKGCNEENVLTAVKHFPGDGVDERDQHIATSINSLSKEEWNDTFGYVYKSLIDQGVKTVMVGHISLPCYQEKDKYLPATLSPELINGLLRTQLGFNGMCITDASNMIGLLSAMDREHALPRIIMSGVDMILFNKDYDEDYAFMMKAYKEGLLTEERLEEAIKRILATKASINLHKDNLIIENPNLDLIGCKEHQDAARKCAEAAITLVKDKENILPINPTKHKKVLLEILGESWSDQRIITKFKEEMEARGYQIVLYEHEVFAFDKPLPFDSVKQIKEKYDLIVYLANVENASNKTTTRINWFNLFGLSNNLPWFVKEVPTIMISFANPYHLLDAPMISTYINCYSNHNIMIETAIKAIHGEIPFKGINPIDPFMGKDYIKNI